MTTKEEYLEEVSKKYDIIKNSKTDVLDDIAFVRLVDYMGDDKRIVDSARVSYGEGTKTVRESTGLISYLIRNKHTSPLEQVVFTFHVKMPIFVARQWIRHRTARLNEISSRYSVMKDEFYIPDINRVAFQSDSNKQGSGGVVPEELGLKVVNSLKEEQEISYTSYQKMLDNDISRELARNNLPVSLYTEMYWQCDLNNLFHFLKLRMDSHAQHEIRVFADAMFEIIKPIVPMAVNSWQNHVKDSVTFSADEIKILKQTLLSHNVSKDLDTILQLAKSKAADSGFKDTRTAEFMDKLGITSDGDYD